MDIGRDRAYLTTDEVDTLGELTDTDIYEGELEAGAHDDSANEPAAENLELLVETELRDGETANADVAAEEGLTWVPPIDPPVVPDPDDPQGIQVAAGFGTEASVEPFDEDHHGELLTASDEFGERVPGGFASQLRHERIRRHARDRHPRWRGGRARGRG